MNRKYKGPYRVIPFWMLEKTKTYPAGNEIITRTKWYEVVQLVDEKNNYQELRPRKIYEKRNSAYTFCTRLNKRRSQDLDYLLDNDYFTS